MATDKRKRAIRSLADDRGISYTAAMRLLDSSTSPDVPRLSGVERNTAWTFTVGTALEEQLQPCTITLDRKQAHLGVFGATGSGKTVLVENLISQALAHPGAGEDQIYVFDPLGELSRERGTHPAENTEGPYSDQDFEPLLTTVHEEMARRFSVAQTQGTGPGSDYPFPALLVVFDHLTPLPHLTDEYPTTAAYLYSFANYGRAVGISVILTHARPGSGEVFDNLGARVLATRGSNAHQRALVTGLIGEDDPFTEITGEYAAAVVPGHGRTCVPVALPADR